MPRHLVIHAVFLIKCEVVSINKIVSGSKDIAMVSEKIMSSTRILDASLLKLPQGLDFPSPGPEIPLSFFDLGLVIAAPIKNLFLYPDFSLSSFEPFKSSLSATLPFFHPFAGELALLPSSSIVISCSSNTGIRFIEAESPIEVMSLARDPIHNMDLYDELVPRITCEELPLPVMVVQVTKFARGGIAIGITVHHAMTDVHGLIHFLRVWGAVCRGGNITDAVKQAMPVHDRVVIGHQEENEIATRLIKKLAPDLPKIPQWRSDCTTQSHIAITRKSFFLDTVSTQFLKKQVMEKGNNSIPIPSTFQVVTAYIWTCIAKAKGLCDDDNSSYLYFVRDCRGLVNPPVPSGYTGNCVDGTRVDLASSMLATPNGLVEATTKIARAIEDAKSKPIKGIREMDEFLNTPDGLKVFVSGILRLYDADFGFGRPERMEIVVTDARDVQVFILAGKEKGTIQVSLNLPKCEMDEFTNIFAKGLDVSKSSRV